MKIIADLHVHTKYARATSKNLDLFELARWAKIKGLDVVACGDFTHPRQFADLQNNLVADGSGLYDLKGQSHGVKFILSTEVACIYKHGGRARRLHHLVIFPSLEAVEKFNQTLTDQGFNIKSDGRPILGMSSKELLQIILETDKRGVLIPAHVWTPWFAIFGSKSGYDSVDECFEDLSEHIFALETGLSSDPEMNWSLSQLDKYSLVSNSDAHSGPNLGREANVFELESLSYDNIFTAIKAKDPKSFLYTIEFFPEEGMYHADGHRACSASFMPSQTKKMKNICPVCKKELTIGVLHRVDNLRDRDFGTQLTGHIPSKKIVPLKHILADYYSVNDKSKRVQEQYFSLIKNFGNEFSILLDWDLNRLKEGMSEDLAQGIIDVRNGKVIIKPGYDGVYGTVKIFKNGLKNAKKQTKLF